MCLHRSSEPTTKGDVTGSNRLVANERLSPFGCQIGVLAYPVFCAGRNDAVLDRIKAGTPVSLVPMHDTDLSGDATCIDQCFEYFD